MKRIFDIFSSFVGLLLLSPILLVVAILILIFLGRPILFIHKRPGLNGKPFNMYKFRSMCDLRGSDNELLPDEERLGAFGRFLRQTSLDELPELFNVLLGDMSLVGPRPLLMEYLPLYNSRQNRRHEVRPGITGWAQINGRNSLSWEEKLEMDVWYVDNRTFILDLRIIVLTFLMVIKREGINQDGHVTMSKFSGSKTDKS